MAKKKKHSAFGSWLSEPSLFDDDESTFVDNHSRRRVYVHLVPAPWSRVILLSLVYALAVNFVKLAWFEFYGRPNWGFVAEQNAVPLPKEDSKHKS